MFSGLVNVYSDYIKRKHANEKFDSDLKQYQKMYDSNGGIAISKLFPQRYDYLCSAGNVDAHYFLQDIYAANYILKNGSSTHYDIGSRVDGFISHLLASPSLDSLTMIDIRPFPHQIDRLKFIQSDATNLSEIEDNSLASLSCLHAVEHFGLGRYGDAVDPQACFKAMKSFQRVVDKGGLLVLSVPISNKDECFFNAHRIFKPLTILTQFDEMKLVEFAYIHDMCLCVEEGEEATRKIGEHLYRFGLYDCGIFCLVKL